MVLDEVKKPWADPHMNKTSPNEQQTDGVGQDVYQSFFYHSR